MKKDDHPGARFDKFALIVGKIGVRQARLFAYEEVMNWKGAAAAHVFGGLRGQLLSLACSYNIDVKPVHVGTIKKFATGSGRASKEEMINAARELYPHLTIKDDNEADAVHLLAYVLKEMSIGK